MPEPAFTLPGIRVHDALEWMFTFGWNLRSRCPGIRTPHRSQVRWQQEPESRPTSDGEDIRELIVRVARENPTWGYTRLRGALKNLGHELGRNTIKRILAEHGIAPAPERGRSMSWSTFIKAHWGAIAATDLFTVEVVNPFGLVRYHVLFVIDIATRCVCIGGITSDPNGEWMKQVARNLTDMWDGFLLGKRYLIHDRDPLFTEAVRGLLRDSGVKPLRLPANSPNLNAYAERFVLSIRRECLDRFVPLSERHLRTAVTEYVVHYHTERNHQGLGNELGRNRRPFMRPVFDSSRTNPRRPCFGRHSAVRALHRPQRRAISSRLASSFVA